MGRWFPMLALSILIAIPARIAHADDTAVCDASYEAAQTSRDAKKLVAARDQLRICSRATCPAFMVKECTGWLTELEPRIPSVVLVANDANGAVLTNVKVTIDGGSASRNMDGTAWDVDPGQHSFIFTTADGTKLERTTVVVEALKAQQVVVTFGASAPASQIPYKTVGYAIAGAGVLGVVIGSIFGVEALSTKSSNCDGNACKPGTSATAYDQGTISTVAFVIGGVLVAGGLALTLLAPAKTSAHTLRIEAAPLIAGGSQGLMLNGGW